MCPKQTKLKYIFSTRPAVTLLSRIEFSTERLGLFGPANLSQYTCPPDGVHPSLNTLEEVCRQAGASHVAAAQYSSLPLAAASCPMRKSSVMPPCCYPLSCTASPVRVPCRCCLLSPNVAAPVPARAQSRTLLLTLLLTSQVLWTRAWCLSTHN